MTVGLTVPRPIVRLCHILLIFTLVVSVIYSGYTLAGTPFSGAGSEAVSFGDGSDPHAMPLSIREKTVPLFPLLSAPAAIRLIEDRQESRESDVWKMIRRLMLAVFLGILAAVFCHGGQGNERRRDSAISATQKIILFYQHHQDGCKSVSHL